MLALDKELNKGHVDSNDAISGSEPMAATNVNENFSERNVNKEVKSKKVCMFVQFTNKTRTGNVRLHHMSKGLKSMLKL